MSKEDNIVKLEKEIKNSNLPLKEGATNLVLGKGNLNADIFILGEAPGRNEDLEGKPFVGQAGKQLDEFLNLINLNLEDVYIANVLKYRPPNNRDPNMDEIRSHTPFLIKQINIIKPKVVVTLGNFATKFSLNGFKAKGMTSVQGISKIHGEPKEVEYNNHKVTVFPMYHPAAMLYNPNLKKILKEDFKKLERLIIE